jgi:hypothetical protein
MLPLIKAAIVVLGIFDPAAREDMMIDLTGLQVAAYEAGQCRGPDSCERLATLVGLGGLINEDEDWWPTACREGDVRACRLLAAAEDDLETECDETADEAEVEGNPDHPCHLVREGR